MEAIRAALGDWHLWEVDDGALRPLLPGVALAADCEELWVRREAGQPWRFELLLDRHSTDAEWVYKRDARVRLPWDEAVHAIDGVEYLLNGGRAAVQGQALPAQGSRGPAGRAP